MINSFNTEIAKEVGVNAAVIFYNISFWIEKNATNSKNMFDGNFWTYYSISAFEEQFEYLSSRQIRTSLEKLVDNNLIIEGKYNKSKYDRTKWYAINKIAFDKYDIPILQKTKIHLSEKANLFDQNDQPIPDSKQQIVNTNNKEKFYKKKFENKAEELKSGITDESYKSVIDWMNKNTPTLLDMNQPLKLKEFLFLKHNFSKVYIKTLFEKMENYKPLKKNNKSVYRTFLNWAQRDGAYKPK